MEGSHQQTAHEAIATLNIEYLLTIHGNSAAGKKSAEKAFYESHDWLRQHRIKFHLAPKEHQWVLDEVCHDD